MYAGLIFPVGYTIFYLNIDIMDMVVPSIFVIIATVTFTDKFVARDSIKQPPPRDLNLPGPSTPATPPWEQGFDGVPRLKYSERGDLKR